ncbi:hypothetical protein [Variovorax sp. KK3]|uniref:hypothetical protein n=1 Tax=Variovorax sp. KK3 TaxID=1855728 RepID=UPI00097C28FE|nr:hypothetical protein [Variovorax sp. KK3]
MVYEVHGECSEFEQFLEEFICTTVNYISHRLAAASSQSLQQLGTTNDVLPDCSTVTAFPCEQCGGALVHHVKYRNPSYDFFGCSGCLDGCMALYSNSSGQPTRVV